MTDRQMTKQELENLQYFLASLGWKTENLTEVDDWDGEVYIKVSRRLPLGGYYSFTINLQLNTLTLERFLEEFKEIHYEYDPDIYVTTALKKDNYPINVPLKRVIDDSNQISKWHTKLIDDMEKYIEIQHKLRASRKDYIIPLNTSSNALNALNNELKEKLKNDPLTMISTDNFDSQMNTSKIIEKVEEAKILLEEERKAIVSRLEVLRGKTKNEVSIIYYKKVHADLNIVIYKIENILDQITEEEN